MSIRCAADFADWYDSVARTHAETTLTDFVHANPGYFGVFVAMQASTSFELSSLLFVDIARLGSGAGGGSAGGIFQDVLRVLSVIPVGKIATVARPLLGGIVQRLANQFYWRLIRGEQCVLISIGQAMQMAGQRLVISLGDVAKAMGRELSSFEGAFGVGAQIHEARTALVALKAEFTELAAGAAAGWTDLVRVAESSEGVVAVCLKQTKRGIDSYHMVLVGKSIRGVRIFDRAGVFSSLDELSRAYGVPNPGDAFRIETRTPLLVIKAWTLDPALAMRLNAMGPLGAVVVKVAMTFGFSPSVPAAAIASAFQDHVAKGGDLYPPPTRPPEMTSLMYTHIVEGPRIEERDWLSSIAKKWYGDALLWPILFDCNKGPDFANQNKMYVGQRVKVPFITAMTPPEIAASRKRGMNWR